MVPTYLRSEEWYAKAVVTKGESLSRFSAATTKNPGSRRLGFPLLHRSLAGPILARGHAGITGEEPAEIGRILEAQLVADFID